MAAAGGEEVIELWPDNQLAFSFFADQCATQWRTGVNGATGLDYTAVLACIRQLRLKREDSDQLFADVRVMERAALEAMRKKD